MRYLKLVLFSIVLFILALFAYYNQGEVFLVFLKYKNISVETIKLPIFVFFYIAILGTIIVMSFLGAFERSSLRLKAKRIEKENMRLKAELDTHKKAATGPGEAAGAPPKSIPAKKRGLFGRGKKAEEEKGTVG
jgi:uncharacterized integral membrane protein